MPDVFDAFTAPYVQRALMAAVLLSVVGAVVGVHVVLRKKAFTVETLQHTVFPGVAASFVAGQSLLAGAIVATLLTVVVMYMLQRVRDADDDSVQAVIITMFLAAGVVLVSTGSSYQHDLTALLFGRMLSVDESQLAEIAVLAIATVVTLLVLHKELLLRAFDETAAAALGYRTVVIDVVLNVCVAVAVIAAVRTVGTVLLVAFIVTPAAASQLIAGSVRSMMLASAGITATSAVVGIWASYQLSVGNGIDVPAGATTVLAITLVFVVCATLGRRSVRGTVS